MAYQISYVVPTLNSAATLESTILSLRQQQSVEVRIIVVDSGSNDGTLEICQKWDVETHYCPPGNMYEAINYGLRLCDTEWLAYLNSDDILYKNCLAGMIELGEKKSADVVYGICDFIDSDGRFLYSFIPPHPNVLPSVMKMGASGMTQQTAIFKKDLYERVKGFNTEFKYAADYDFYIRALSTQSCFVFAPFLPIAGFRLHENQLSYQNRDKMLIEGNQILANTLWKPTIYDLLLSIIWRLSNTKNYIMKFLRSH
jgi:glycosyltransferase involved in cell wall biosynthesis